MVARARMMRANGLDVGLLEAGTGPLALCLHGFPDGAHTWRHLLPVLAADAERLLPRSSRMIVVPDAGHFLHLEQPAEVNRHILSWITG
jgi:pimeloyl-ACP methyl ester carboxylesterase